MILLLCIPAFAFVSFVQAVLQAWAPSNILVRRVKAAPPRWGTAAALLLLAYALALVVHAGEVAMAVGAPAWLAFPVGILAWDAIKVVLLGVHTSVRASLLAWAAVTGRRGPREGPARVPWACRPLLWPSGDR